MISENTFTFHIVITASLVTEGISCYIEKKIIS